MTYVAFRRQLALQESRALRAFARQGRPPRTTPLDTWAEWINHTKARRRAA